MKEKTLIAIWGSSKQGKSQTVRKIADLILSEYPKATSNYILNGSVDITVIIIIDKIKIGIESQGDPNTNLKNSLDLFAKDNCDIILCSSRTKGEHTVKVIKKIAKHFEYNLIWATNLRSDKSKDYQDYLNDFSAKQIFEFIQTLLK